MHRDILSYMSGLTFIVLIILLIYVIAKSKPVDTQDSEQLLQERDRQWRSYISAFSDRVKTKAEEQLIARMLRGDADPDDETSFTATTPSSSIATEPSAALVESEKSQVLAAAGEDDANVTQKEPVDNALLLLYFGAFLFVASAGLFVAFGNVAGSLRALVVVCLSAALYSLGLWLHAASTRLGQAGVAFTAIGMAIAPLAGLAVYTYVFDQTAGSIIWFVTSLVVLLMYGLALYRIRSTFIGYLFIFSFLSLAQSAMSIIEAPLYLFIWTLILSGMLLRIASLRITLIPQLHEPTVVSSQLIIPLSLFVSLLSVGGEGLFQLAVSLAFASAYYGLEAILSRPQRLSLITVSHIFGLLAVAVGAFSYQEMFRDVTLSVLIMVALHVGVLIRLKQKDIAEAIATNAMAAAVFAPLFALNDAPYLLAALLVALGFGLFVSFWQRRPDGLLLGLSALFFLPIVIGQAVMSPAVDASMQAIISTAVVGAVVALRYEVLRWRSSLWSDSADSLLVLVTLGALVPAVFASVFVSFVLIVALAGLYVVLGAIDKQSRWVVGSGLVVSTFIFKGLLVATNPTLTAAMVLVVTWNIALALHFRDEVTRWLGSFVWFFLPPALAVEGFGFTMKTSGYAWSYLGVMVGFLVARAIARGVIARSSRASLSSYESSSSSVYVLGYIFSGSLAVGFSLLSSNSQLHASLITLALMVATYLASVHIEKQPTLLGLIPLLAQLLLLTSIQPIGAEDGFINLYLVASSFVALVCYWSTLQHGSSAFVGAQSSWRMSALLTLFVAPASVLLFTETYLLMPVLLAVAGAVTLYEARQEGQSSREASGLIIVVALMWLMGYFGVTSFQAYSHVAALTLGLYAYWRYRRDEQLTSDTYLRYMFLVATIPLLLQALGRSGDLYGWWLILEQVGFMLLGMVTGRRFLTTWGLYVSVAAILYQLRDLGWAALTFLAVFIIGLAIYHLNKSGSNE